MENKPHLHIFLTKGVGIAWAVWMKEKAGYSNLGRMEQLVQWTIGYLKFLNKITYEKFTKYDWQSNKETTTLLKTLAGEKASGEDIEEEDLVKEEQDRDKQESDADIRDDAEAREDLSSTDEVKRYLTSYCIF